MIFLYKFLLISISYMVLLHSARTAYATLASAPLRLSFRRRFAVRSAHSAHTLALLVRSSARPGRARGLFKRCRYCSIIRTLPLVARGSARTAYATLALPTLPSGRTGSLSGVALLRIKNTRIYCIKVIKI